MKVTRDSYNFNSLVKLMLLHRQILFILAVAAIVRAILMQVSAGQVPFLHRIATRYSRTLEEYRKGIFTLAANTFHYKENDIAF